MYIILEGGGQESLGAFPPKLDIIYLATYNV